MSQDYELPALTTQPLVHINYSKKSGIGIVILLELFRTAFLGAELSISDSLG